VTSRQHHVHEEFADAISAYALGSLDRQTERDALEAHLTQCEACRAELDVQRTTADAIGLSVEPVAPPAALRARVLAAASASVSPVPLTPRVAVAARRLDEDAVPRTAKPMLAWLAAAAAVIVAAGSLAYALTVQLEIAALTAMASAAAARAETLNAEVVALRRESSELVRVLNVIGAPDVQLASLSGQGAATGALGRAYWSRTQGLVFRAVQLPPLATGRNYQLWIVPASGAPVSMGVIEVQAEGSSSHTTPLTNLAAATAVALTIEPTGGSAAPTMPIVMVGNLGT
jgi:hypothetical protein